MIVSYTPPGRSSSKQAVPAFYHILAYPYAVSAWEGSDLTVINGSLDQVQVLSRHDTCTPFEAIV